METPEHTQHEPAEDEHAEDEHTEDESSYSDEDAEYEPSEYEHAGHEQTGSEHADDEATEYGHTVYHTNEFRMSAPAALIRNQIGGQRFKFVQFGTMIGEDLSLAGAAVKEKLSVAGSTIGYGAYTFTHPLHPVRRRAAKDAYREQKKLASDRRRERVGDIRSNAAAKIAKAREARIAILEEGVH